MKYSVLILLSLLLFAACSKDEAQPQTNSAPRGSNGDRPKQTLAEARHGFKTQLVSQEKDGTPAPTPPAGMFRLVKYKSPGGEMAAYLTALPKDKKKHPAIVWIAGGFDNSIGDGFWRGAKPENDQTADAFWKAGVITLYPSFRGGNDNSGFREILFGEVDDALAAAEFLAKQDGVDPHRIYLGGHSTGGTMALLTAAATTTPERFRAVFAFGPIDDVSHYRQKLPFDTNNPREVELRSPINWLHSIRIPLFAFEGTRGNITALQALADSSHNPLLHFEPVAGVDHFSILSRITPLVRAESRHADDGQAAACNIRVRSPKTNCTAASRWRSRQGERDSIPLAAFGCQWLRQCSSSALPGCSALPTRLQIPTIEQLLAKRAPFARGAVAGGLMCHELGDPIIHAPQPLGQAVDGIVGHLVRGPDSFVDHIFVIAVGDAQELHFILRPDVGRMGRGMKERHLAELAERLEDGQHHGFAHFRLTR